jgi:hypothetical protein
MTSHTPGPWTVIRGRGLPDEEFLFVGKLKNKKMPDDLEVCMISWPDSPNAKANAALIAASPTMFEALKDALFALSTVQTTETAATRKRVRDAIALASPEKETAA